MPPEAANAEIDRQVSGLNRRFGRKNAAAVMEHVLNDPPMGPVALVSSFGAESIVLLHMASRVNSAVSVLFVDTEMLFAETLSYHRQVASKLKLSNVRVIRPDRDAAAVRDSQGLLHQLDTDACCALRKTEPLSRALAAYDGWITGRKRFQGQSRQNLQLFENEADIRIKINPLVNWSSEDIQSYISENDLPRHPLVTGGYPSIGCWPCTSRISANEDARAGRWRGQEKEECGIHFAGGQAIRCDHAA